MAAAPGLAALEAEIAAHLDDARRGERLRKGFTMAIAGAPNAGKSSLLNRLAGRDAAIVSTRAGNTRYIVEVRLDLAGWPVTLAVVGPADERLAEELRLAAHALGRITGRVDAEAVLDLVFRDFCIGK